MLGLSFYGLSLGAKIALAICTSLSFLLMIGYASHEFKVQYAYGKVSPSQSASGPYLNDSSLRAEVVFRGLDFPSSMAFLGNNDILVLEKNEGTVRRIVNGTMLENPLLKVNVSTVGERGMLGIAVARDNSTISKPLYIFLYYTEVAEANPRKDLANQKLGESPASNRLYRYELLDDKLVHPKLLLDLPVSTRYIHNGGTISIGTDGNVYLAVGDLFGENPQESDLPSGKAGILRVNQDGQAVKTNVSEYVFGNTHPINKYYAYGIRNSFGMDFDPVAGNLWDTENGPGFGDEINLVGPGFNSGWREIQGFWNEQDQNTAISYPDNILDFKGKSYYSHPELASVPSMGFTGLSFLDTTRYGIHYENDLVASDFHNGFLYRFELSRERTELNLTRALGDKIADNMKELDQNILGRGFGGITDIDVGPDGYLYILSLYKGGDNCPGMLSEEEIDTLSEEEIDTLSEEKDCINYDSELQGTLFRIVRE
jgi:aldose sugar dehydrogenase